jgi:hypothetical protein
VKKACVASRGCNLLDSVSTNIPNNYVVIKVNLELVLPVLMRFENALLHAQC